MVAMVLPSAFLYTLMEPKYPKVHMKLQGKMSDLMVKVYPNLYRKFVSTDSKGHMILYVEMQKDLYRMLKSALLFYMKLVEIL